MTALALIMWVTVALAVGYVLGRVIRRRDRQAPRETAPTPRPTSPDRGPLVFIAAPTQQAAHHWRASQALNPSHVRVYTTATTLYGLTLVDGDRIVILDGTPADVRVALATVRTWCHGADVTVEVPEVGYRSR